MSSWEWALPTASSFTQTNATVGSAYSGSLVGRATDADTDVLTFAKVSGPSWLTVGSNGTLSGTPAAGDAGTGSYSVSVTDPDGQSATATMSITVYGALPSGWTAGDIGSTGVLGSSGYTSGTAYTITATGNSSTGGAVYTVDQTNLMTTKTPSTWGANTYTGCWIMRKGDSC